MSSQSPCWIALGDIHGDTSRLAGIAELDGAAGIIVTGDLTTNGGEEAARAVMARLRSRSPRILAQVGNMDRKPVDRWLTGEGCNLHARCVALDAATVLMGIGGSVPTPMHTPTEFTEEEYAAWLEACWKEAENYPRRILASHNPPKDTACDRIASGAHVGSTAVRAFLETHEVDLCLCGHIHESAGEDRVGTALVLNPGAFARGGYVVVELGGTGVAARMATARRA